MIVDLSHLITSEMQVYPGSKQPGILNVNTISRNGYAEKNISMSTHTGTHIDAPAHMMDGLTLDKMEIANFIGSGFVIDISGLGKKVVTIEDIGYDLDKAENCEFVLFNTGWSGFWGTDQYFNDYPVLSAGLAEKISLMNFKGIGMDVMSVDPVGATEYINHMIFFKKGLLIIENLTNLDQLPESGFTFVCNPLKIKDADGSPLRAFAIISGE